MFIGTDFDLQFQTSAACANASSCNNQILSTINGTKVMYQAQFNVTFTVSTQYGPTNLGTETDSAKALETFRNLNNGGRSAAKIDLFQLHTGRRLKDSVIGLAYVGTTCARRSFADMLVQHLSNTIDILTTAHEAGHTFDANHPSPPGTKEGGIMDASLTSDRKSTRLNSSHSTLSRMPSSA